MPRIHVFAIDWVPGPDEVASGGGLRSAQVIAALRAASHDVTWSVPRDSRAVQALVLADPDRLRQHELHDERNQLTLLRRLAPDLVAWLWPSARQVPFSGLGTTAHLCDLNGLQDYELANGAPALLDHARARLAASCAGADAVLTGSPEQHGYWLARLGEGPAAPPAYLAGYAPPPAFQGRVIRTGARLRRLHVTGNIYAWSASVPLLARCADWAARHGAVRLHIIGGTDPGGATGLDDLARLRALAASPAVDMPGETPFRAAMAAYGPGSVALDLADPSIERALAVPIRTVNALAHGVPVLTTTDSPFTRRMARAGAAVIAPPDGLEATLDRLAALPATAFAAMSAAASRFAEQEFATADQSAAIAEAAAAAIARRRDRARAWQSGRPAAPPLGQVLVISGELPNIRELRVDQPMAQLQRRRLIGGYTVWDRGRITYSTRGDGAGQVFDAIWVQRCVSAEMALVLDALDLPFVYDLDDNLLVSPSYRAAFAAENLQAARNFVRRATVLSVATARLAGLLRRHSATELVDRVVVTPNLMRCAPPPRRAGEPGCVVWASSDMPALTTGRLAVVRAVRDFCLSHQLRLVCVGAEPPPLLLESEVEIEHVGLLPYAGYLDLLRSLAPAILVCPLETDSDPATQDFVDGKSDIKVLEALATGLVGVFSAACAYRDSDLPGAILCDNSYRSWFEGLARARRACLEPDSLPAMPHAIPPWRLADELGAMPYFDALARARLPRPIQLAELADRLALIRGRLSRRLRGPEDFDEEFYLAKYPDVRAAFERRAIASAYAHYLESGFAEGRMARGDDALDGQGAQWWANLMHTVNDLRNTIDNRTPQIEELKARRALRMRRTRAT